MQTLIIGTPELRERVEQQTGKASDVIWVNELECAFSKLEILDIDAIVFDVRSRPLTAHIDLKRLIANVPVTTRVLAIVDQLPEEEIFSAAGIVYLTPPVNLDDVLWFIRSSRVRVQSG